MKSNPGANQKAMLRDVSGKALQEVVSHGEDDDEMTQLPVARGTRGGRSGGIEVLMVDSDVGFQHVNEKMCMSEGVASKVHVLHS